jgi:hypothetical protein
MRQRSLLMLIAISLLCTTTLSQTKVQQLTIEDGCNYYGDSFSATVYTFESDQGAIEVIDRILGTVGLARNFDIKAADVPNAAATIVGTTRYLLYNQEFMRRVKAVTNTDWAAISIMAHEIGHHLNGHTLDKRRGSQPPLELEADSFSGFILYKMGATLEQAQVAIVTISSEEGSATHPPRRSRLAAIEAGWTKAKDGDRNKTTSAAKSPTNKVTLKDIEVSFRSNLFDQTIRSARTFLETTPESKEAHAYLGLSLLIKKDLDNAAIHLEQSVLLGEPLILPVKRLREPLIGHGLDDVRIALTPKAVIINSGKTYFQADYSALSEFRVGNYNNQCPIIFLKGIFVETSDGSQKTKQGEKGFNLFPPTAVLQPTQQGNLVYNLAACSDDGTVTIGIMKVMVRLMANR